MTFAWQTGTEVTLGSSPKHGDKAQGPHLRTYESTGRQYDPSMSMSITEVTRTALIDELIMGRHWWFGRLDQVPFLSRIYNLGSLPSRDPRYRDAAGDIVQHTLNNDDWEVDWIFYDDRFDLARDDEALLRFLSETLHPMVRPDREEAATLAALYNSHLIHDGYELVPVRAISGRPIYEGRTTLHVPPALDHVSTVVQVVDRAYLNTQIRLMNDSIETDPHVAIGTAKEMVETICKTILEDRGITPDSNWDLGRLVKETSSHLALTPESIDQNSPAAETIRRLLGNLAQVTKGLSELRNSYGSGHGRALGTTGLNARHARLAVGAASTLAFFLYETHEARRG
jgi:hypothetical protein